MLRLHHRLDLFSCQGKLGFKPPDNWSDAVVEAERINADVDRRRQNAGSNRGPREGSISDLILRYSRSDKFTDLAPKTQKEYRKHLTLIEDLFGDLPAGSITRPVVQEFRDKFSERRRWGNAVLATLRLILGHAMDLGWIEHNAAAKFRAYKTPPRQQIWTFEQEETFIQTAQEMNLHSVALAFMLGLYTAQRQADVIRLTWHQYDGAWLTGIKQRKTNRLLDIPVLPPLKIALDSSPRRSPVILLAERGQPYTGNNLRHRFARVVERCGLQGLEFRDLRRTAVVRMAEAGLTVPEISSYSGHDIDECQKIIDTYLPRTRQMAANAAAKLQRYYHKIWSDV